MLSRMTHFVGAAELWIQINAEFINLREAKVKVPISFMCLLSGRIPKVILF